MDIKINWDKLFKYATFGFALISLLILVHNVFANKFEDSYDYFAHLEVLEYYSKPFNINLVTPDNFRFSYNAPLYYIIIGKIHFLAEYLLKVDFNPFLTARILHLIGFLTVWYLVVFRLLKKLGLSNLNKLIFTLLFFIIPNQYLGLLMVRADHLAFISLGLLIYFWFYYDFLRQIHHSTWRKIVWGLLLIGIGNSRHLLLPICLLFLSLGSWKILFPLSRLKIKKTILNSIFILIVITLAFNFYIIRIISTGSPTSYATSDMYVKKYEIYETYRPLSYKLEMLFNFEFDRMFTLPNRQTIYGGFTNFNPESIDKLLYEEKIYPVIVSKGLDLDTYILQDGNYILNKDKDQITKAYGYAAVYSVINYNNAYFPRLINDMWGDHWLYFSGPRSVDNEVKEKQVVLLVTIPLTLIYFGSGIWILIKSIRKKDWKSFIDIQNLLIILFLVSFTTLTIYSSFIFTEAGKNSIVKFIYLGAFFYLPFLSLSIYLKNKVKTSVLLLIYFIIVYIISIPLYIY